MLAILVMGMGLLLWLDDDHHSGNSVLLHLTPLPGLTTQTATATITPTPMIQEHWQSITIAPGDNLSTLFKQIGLTPQDVYQVNQAAHSAQMLRKLFPGDQIDFLTKEGQLQKVRHIRSRLEQDVMTLNDEGTYDTEILVREPVVSQELVQVTINHSLFVDGEKSGLSQKKLMELTNIFAWDVDFALDIRNGDSFALIYEKHYLDEQIIGEGHILAAQFINQGRVINAVRHHDDHYYNKQGYSMSKAFLRSPVDFFRISSKYNLKRKHPILNTVRAHRGVDYAAATGTPIKAAGDGRVIWRGSKGGYGRTIIIQHAGTYTTLYAHISKYHSRVKQGTRVKQGQVIGYVGSSGMATGPHLHYEFRVNGVHKNPLKVKLPNAKPLTKKNMQLFKPLAASLLNQLQAYIDEQHL